MTPGSRCGCSRCRPLWLCCDCVVVCCVDCRVDAQIPGSEVTGRLVGQVSIAPAALASAVGQFGRAVMSRRSRQMVALLRFKSGDPPSGWDRFTVRGDLRVALATVPPREQHAPLASMIGSAIGIDERLAPRHQGIQQGSSLRSEARALSTPGPRRRVGDPAPASYLTRRLCRATVAGAARRVSSFPVARQLLARADRIRAPVVALALAFVEARRTPVRPERRGWRAGTDGTRRLRLWLP